MKGRWHGNSGSKVNLAGTWNSIRTLSCCAGIGRGIEMKTPVARSRTHLGLLVLSLFSLLLGSAPAASADANHSAEARPATFRLPGHVLPALKKATIVSSERHQRNQAAHADAGAPARRPSGFDHFLHDLYHPHSSNFHKFLTQRQIARRFSPSRADLNASCAG